MESLGGIGFVIEPNQHSICLALDHAVAVARQKREERLRHADLVAIFTQFQEGVICIDSEERVVFSNPLALQLLNVASKTPEKALAPFFSPLGLKEVLRTMQPKSDKVVSMAGESFVVRSFPLSMHGDMRCAVAFFRDVSSLQKINRKIGEELYIKGFVARSGIDDIVGDSPPMTKLKENIRRFANAEAAVLISGETGTGKELAAHALHQESARRRKPFVAVNFASLAPNLIESELFGYEDGAFTGAKRGGKMGLFEMADQGTLFLDEVGEISHEMQLRLLRVLEARELMRVGGSRIFSVDVRILSASHQPLLELVRAGRFRLDLYYRLSTLKLSLPPLRERAEDIPLILKKLLQRYEKPASIISADMLQTLNKYPWPGNIRELLALVESYLLLLDKPEADPALFHAILRENRQPAGPGAQPIPEWDPSRTLKENLEAARTQFMRQAVQYYGGDRQLAALKLGISNTTLWRTLKGTELPATGPAS
ncbi:MAG: sigma 54-interacting transcriptional regulator [Desulfovibrio sp.]|jgi:propionate catabolism operon transcriptional regulator|nr:sigma 54-interacting transcriptional regulator [Desulfovibrio sp.]